MDQGLPEGVTGLLVAWSNGDQGALEGLTPLVYAELHRLAKIYMGREQAGHTLQTSALVNEAYLRLIDVQGVRWQNRAHFLPFQPRSCGTFSLISPGQDRTLSAAAGPSKSRWTKDWSCPRRVAPIFSRWMRLWKDLRRSMLDSARWSSCATSVA